MPKRTPVPPKAVRPKPRLTLVVPLAVNAPSHVPAKDPPKKGDWVDQLVENLNHNVRNDVPTP